MIPQKIRIGISIRQPEVRFRLNSNYMSSDRIFPRAQYQARPIEPSNSPHWGLKLASFLQEAEACAFAERLQRDKVDVEILKAGVPVTVEGKVYYSEVWYVAAGSWQSPNDALKEQQKWISENPSASTCRFPDEIPRIEVIRLSKPEGGRVKIAAQDGSLERIVESPIRISPASIQSAFEIEDVRIGIDFPWDHREQLSFRGDLELVVDGDRLTLVNEIVLEDYLVSLLGSEMRPDWHLDALAAQAVAARSTVLATRGRHHYAEAFDLCHDDHCQCYQGVTHESDIARKALQMAPSALLVYQDKIVDARYSKACGGFTEDYATAWEDWTLPYLKSVVCGTLKKTIGDKLSLQDNLSFGRHLGSNLNWIACNPEVFPYPPSSRDMESNFRWSVSYTNNDISEKIYIRTGRDLGMIHDLQPLRRGASGRIIFLRVVGENGQITVGKELSIRRLLSDSHLPSSAFLVHKQKDGGFTLSGLGWGHGVGLCQLGSAALAQRGWSWSSLLKHYYPGASLIYLR